MGRHRKTYPAMPVGYSGPIPPLRLNPESGSRQRQGLRGRRLILKPARAFPSAPSTGKETAASDAEDLVVRQEAPHSLKTSQHAVNARNIGRAW